MIGLTATMKMTMITTFLKYFHISKFFHLTLIHFIVLSLTMMNTVMMKMMKMMMGRKSNDVLDEFTYFLKNLRFVFSFI